MAPPFLSGDDNNWEKVVEEIILATSALRNFQEGKVVSPPPGERLRLFQHISILVTTGEFGEEDSAASAKKRDIDLDAAIVNAVTGRVDADRIVFVVFTRNAIPIDKKSTGVSFKQIISQDNGKVLLDAWETMRCVYRS